MTYYLVGGEHVLQSVAPCDGRGCEQVKIPENIARHTRQMIAQGRVYPRRERLSPKTSEGLD